MNTATLLGGGDRVELATVAESIRAGASALGISLAPEAPRRLAVYTGLLLGWNKRVNLIARGREVEEVIERHILDSLALIAVAPPLGRTLDVGSGAGLPGLVLWLALVDDLDSGADGSCSPRSGPHLRLLEPNHKRAAFLRAVLRELVPPAVMVSESRLESLAGERFDLLLSRAAFAPSEWLRRGAELLAPRGRIVVMLARRDHEEVCAVAAELELRQVAEQRFELPLGKARRCNLVFANGS